MKEGGRYWDDPVMATDKNSGSSEDLDNLLREASSAPARTLFIMSAGFDPRCLTALSRYIEAVGTVPTVLAIDPQPPEEASLAGELTARRAANEAQIVGLARHKLLRWEYPRVFDDASAGRELARALTTPDLLGDIDAVFFDLSAFPTSLAFPMLNALLQRVGETGFPTELLVLVTENPRLDGAIGEGGLGPAQKLPGFGRRSERARSNAFRVWAPVLGRGAGPALEKIAHALDPDEVCPVLPFPARDPRLADNLLLEHRSSILERFEVQPTSFIYAAETNPFDLYRTLVKFDADYQKVLEPIGGVDVTVSTHGSKLLSIGALLAAFEQNLQVLAVRATRRSLASDFWDASARSEDQLACVWLKGEPYVP